MVYTYNQTLGDGEIQGSLQAAVQGVAESDTTERLQFLSFNKKFALCQEPAREIPPMTRRPDKQGFSTRGTLWADPTHDKVMWRDLMSKVDQDSRDPLDLLEHRPPNQSLFVLLFYAFHRLF